MNLWDLDCLVWSLLLVEGPDDLLDELFMRIVLFQGSWWRELLLILDVWYKLACVIMTNLEISSLVPVEVHDRWLLNEDWPILCALKL